MSNISKNLNVEKLLRPFFYTDRRNTKMKTTTSNDADRLMNPSEAARWLGISRRTLHSLTVAGKVPSARLGPRCVRYSRKALEQLVERQLEKSIA